MLVVAYVRRRRIPSLCAKVTCTWLLYCWRCCCRHMKNRLDPLFTNKRLVLLLIQHMTAVHSRGYTLLAEERLRLTPCGNEANKIRLKQVWSPPLTSTQQSMRGKTSWKVHCRQRFCFCFVFCLTLAFPKHPWEPAVTKTGHIRPREETNQKYGMYTLFLL